MGILDRFRKNSTSAAPAIEVACPHTALMGRWDSVDDMGKEEKITAFVCDACHQSFTPEEGRALRVSTADRLHTEDIERARLRAERDAG
jgi:hypothetical protein